MKIRDLFVEVRVKADRALRDLRMIDRLTKAGAVAMTGLGKTAGRVGREIEAGAGKAAKGLERVGKASKDAAGLVSSLGGMASSAFAAVGGAVVGATKKAIEFETSMAEISKVVGGLKTDTGETTAEFDKMKDTIFGLSKEIAKTPKDFAKIIAAAGQAGIANDAFKISAEAGRKELARFAEDAAKMAVAFDIGADEAGDAMAKMRTGLGLSQDEVFKLAGTINHLSNNMASAAGELVDVTKRVGALGGAAGLTGEQVTAIGSAMISSGAKTNVAATGIKNFTLAMAAGEAATLRQRTAYAAMGLEAEDVAKRFAKGGKETEDAIMDVLSRLKGLDDAKRAATIMQLFGRESMGAIAPLVTQIDNMGKAFDLASDKTAAAESVQKEFNVRSKTTANAIQLLENRLEIAAIEIGDALLPALNDLLDLMSSPEATAIGDAIVDGIRWVVKEAPALLASMREKIEPIITSIIGYITGYVEGISSSFDTIVANLGPIFDKIVTLATKVMEALGLAGDKGKEFGEDMGEDVGGAAVSAVEAFSAALDALIVVITTLSPIISAIATLIKGVLSAAILGITDSIDYLKGLFNGLTDAFQAFASGNFGDAFIALGRSILDGLVMPIRTAARMMIDLADSIGASSAVPAALREFAGMGAAGGIIGKAKGAAAAAGKKAAADEAAAAEAPMAPSRASMQGGDLSKREKPAAAAAAEEAGGGEGGGEGEGGGNGKPKGRKKKDKKGEMNLLDKAVEEAKKKERVLGGTDRAAQQAGPAVTNIYNTFNMEIDARGNEGAAGNVERGAKRGAMAGVDKLRGLGSASMLAKGGGGAAAGAG